MRRIFISAVFSTGLLALAPVSNAAIFDFQAWIDANGERGFDNSAPFTMTDAALTLTATASESAGKSNVYMDGFFNGAIGGMGVCTTLNTNDQCADPADDNVSLDGGSAEVLSWNFSQNISQMTLELGDSEHISFTDSNFEYSLDNGLSWLIATTDANAMTTLLLTGTTSQIDFRTAGANLIDAFYIRNADVAVVPVPAAALLFGSGLLGLIGIARRKRA